MKEIRKGTAFVLENGDSYVALGAPNSHGYVLADGPNGEGFIHISLISEVEDEA